MFFFCFFFVKYVDQLKTTDSELSTRSRSFSCILKEALKLILCFCIFKLDMTSFSTQEQEFLGLFIQEVNKNCFIS